MNLQLTDDDFTAWIAKHRMLFLMNRKHYTTDHICELARIGEFNEHMVYRRLSHIDYELAQTSIDKSAIAKANWTITEIMIHDGLNLDAQWIALNHKLTDGLDFDEAA